MDKGKLNRRKSRASPLLVGLILSILFHVTFLVSKFLSESPEISEANQEPIEITEVPKSEAPAAVAKKKPEPKSKQTQIAETEDAKNRKANPKAKYLSEHDQEAEKQTRAHLVDDFRKKLGSGLKNENLVPQRAPPPPTGSQQAEVSVEEKERPGEGKIAKKHADKGIKRDWKTLSLKDLSVAGDGAATAASDDKLDEAEGDRTVLSTKEFKFFSYYQRIKELLRQYWKPNVERKLARMYRTGRTVHEEEMVTKLLVLLDDKGSVQRISRVSGSGVEDLDDAAIEAFRKAAPFPNPPHGIIDDDGFVRIRWDFILTLESSPRIQFSTVGNAPPGY